MRSSLIEEQCLSRAIERNCVPRNLFSDDFLGGIFSCPERRGSPCEQEADCKDQTKYHAPLYAQRLSLVPCIEAEMDDAPARSGAIAVLHFMSAVSLRPAHPPWVRLVQLTVKLADFLPCPRQRFSSSRGNSVHLPAVSSALIYSLQQACAFQPVQQRVERARSDAIAVMCQFPHHRQPEDRLLARVQQHVNAHEAVEKFALVIHNKTHYTGVYRIFP